MKLFYRKSLVSIKLSRGRVSPGLIEVLQSQRVPIPKQPNSVFRQL